MARPLLFPSSISSSFFSIHVFSFNHILFAVFGVLSITSMVIYLCASRKLRTKEEVFGKRKSQTNTLLSRFTRGGNNGSVSISSKALLKMISGRKQQVRHEDHQDHDGYEYDDDDDEYYDHGEEDPVWMKTIIMGEKCRPLDFSGKIEYDSQGNLLQSQA